MCCLCEAIKLEYITRESIVILDASGSTLDKNDMGGLVKYYESLGFQQIDPEYYEIGVRQTIVPMKAKVKSLIKRCSFENISPELLSILPTKLCDEICE
jgi:hypothetical protein